MRTLPSWGLITAAPHEHLLHVRNGRILRAEQGGSAFRWPGDTVALIDTSVHRLHFTADQVTRERTGVQVTGLAVFRVVEPRIAWRMLDLGEPDRFRTILAEMFVGATRRLVANLTLDDCLERRKDALAAELMSEVAPVVRGAGRSGDTADGGWGIVIDTIEIQDVRVLSREVFERLQAPYRATLALSAVAAEAEVAAAQAAVRNEAERQAEGRRREMLALAEERVIAERERARAEATHQQALGQMAVDAELRRDQQRAAGSVETARLQGEARKIAAEAEAAALRMCRAATDEVSEGRLRELLYTETAPRMAEALTGIFGEVIVRPDDLARLAEAAINRFGR